MPAPWERLHRNLEHGLRILWADRQFRMAAAEEPILAAFSDPEHLVAFLDADGDQDEKDAIYRILVQAFQRRADWSDLASKVIWLGLWPRLDHVFHRRLRRSGWTPEVVVAEMSYALTTRLASIDLDLTSDVANSLVETTEHAVRRQRKAEQEHRRVSQSLSFKDEESGELAEEGVLDPETIDEDRQLEAIETHGEHPESALRAKLFELLGPDAALVSGVVLLDLNLQELADMLGITHAAARQRYHRAIKRLRETGDRNLLDSCHTRRSRSAYRDWKGSRPSRRERS